MKKSLLAIAILGAFSSAAMAQSNVTVYGVIDASTSFTTNENATGGHQLSMGNGIFEGSRLGFKGMEDLGGGTAAVFDLEAGFSVGNGSLSNQGQLFGSQAWVGLKNSDLGEIDAGRQYGLSYQTLGSYAPLGRGIATEQGNTPQLAWQTALYGVSFDNSLEYTKDFGPVKAQAQYSFGGAAGSTSLGSTAAGSLKYVEGPISVGGVLQQSKDANSNDLTVWGLGGSYVAGPATLFLSYADAKRDHGFGVAPNLSGGPLANTNLLANTNTVLQRTDNVWTTGVGFQATPAWNFTVGYMHDAVKNVSDLGNSGGVSTVYAVADYSLSKRTDVYFEADSSRLKGGEIASADVLPISGGNSERNSVAAGLRVRF
ncbi:MAG TPA: porin [Burkholderiaceae bacterium]|nr:porin [Burkholderiaceae bacterium]